jgi:hypothetical protein
MMTAADVNDYDDLRRIGIGLDGASIDKMAEGLGMDSNQALTTTASIAVPIQFLQKWLPGFVRIMTAARKIDELLGIQTVGNWHDEEVVQGVQELTGNAVPYGDYTNVPFTSWNANWERRSIVRFEEGMRVGELEERRAAAIQMNSAAAKREGAGLALEIKRNDVGFNGYNSGNNRTYGLLNDPNLPAYVNVAAGASSSLLWSQKTFLEITADIRTAIVGVRTTSQDIIDPETTNITLGLPTNAVDRLSTTSDFGISVREWLTKTYPRVRVVSAPQFNTANGGAGVFYLYAERVVDLSTDDGGTFAQIVPSKFEVVGVAKAAKGFEEDYSNACAGVLLKRPYAVYRASGIS